ncbi:MAG: hypothetical protein ACI8X3_001303 [Saprospiraceae bacterium]|jgi:hypothetical protein
MDYTSYHEIIIRVIRENICPILYTDTKMVWEKYQTIFYRHTPKISD